MLFSSPNFSGINWAHCQDCKQEIRFLLLTECTEVSKQSPTNYCIDNRAERIHILIASFPPSLSIWRWKDLSCCFLLLHYLLPCGALLAGFISDFAGCFWGSLWNVFLTPNNPFPRFLSLAPVAFSLMINPPPKIFKVNWATRRSQNPFNTVLRKGDVVLVPWLTWKENRGSFLSLALLASLVLYGWTSNDWLGVICVTIEATWTLFYVLCWRLLHSEWGGFLFEERRCVSDSATRWWSYSWIGMRLTGSGSGEGSRYHWKIWEIWWCLKPHNHILKQICSIPVFMNITKLHTPSENLWLHLHITNLPVSYCQLLPVKAQVCSEGNKERGQSQRDPVQQGSRNNFNILKGHSWYLWIVVWLVNYTLFDSVDMYIIRPLN